MARNAALLFALGALTTTQACALPLAEDAEPAAHVGSATQDLYRIYPWLAGQANRRLEREDTHVCALNGVYGVVRDGESVSVKMSGDYWTLVGETRENSTLRASAVCFPLTDFQLPEGVRDYLPINWASGIRIASRANAATGCGPKSDWQFGNLPTHAVRIDGLGGPWNPAEADLDITQPSRAADPPLASLLSCSRGGLHSGYIGILDVGIQPKFLKDGARATASNANEYHSGNAFETDSAWLPPVSRAFCYFTRIRGYFSSGSGSQTINPARDPDGVIRWQLRTTRGRFASARCVALDQR
jgi:hypothetical protein